MRVRFLERTLPVVLVAACSDEPVEKPPVPAFPADYAASYAEVRDCRRSGDHELAFIRVLTDPAATVPYENRTEAFPDGSVVLKEEYEFGDDTCSGVIASWTVMVKAGAATDQLGWNWQRVGGDRRVLDENSQRCLTCHFDCSGNPSVGYDHTCAEPP
jgi:hypothetical protein